MTDAECAEILSEFRKLTLGPELSAALDHAIGVLRLPKFGEPQAPVDWLKVVQVGVPPRKMGGSVSSDFYDGVLMNSRAIDLAMA